MKLSSIAAIVSLTLCSATFSVGATEQEEKTATIGEQILDKVKSKLLNGFGSLLADAVFGSGGPQYVMLSEESLQAIQDRVRKEIVRDAEYDFIAEFRSVEASLKHYGDTVKYKGEDPVLLGGLLIKANDLINHRALNSRYNDDFFYLADTYALAASVVVAIYTERHLAGLVPKSTVVTAARNLANQLSTMLAQKKQADLPLRSGCDDPDPYDQAVEYRCWLRDPYGNHLASYVVEPQYPEDHAYWESRKAQAELEYKQTKFDKIQAVIDQLRNL
ncbi:hypothetical protein HUZ36_17575 [Pseudoalteromonas sp. McH1-7]|uniref:Uncharacterized protein n=1 Tax=Pseudoalteromonas peptidolytica F12-50-A1 TaxID=1315280 RepID=A0A8I0N144_9GAMM|nr:MULTISPECIES: hypothetical protein [Pseudoalteromonas]MBE0349208.1 hypothetical protein [Pseudoalteromonas peptidolytica F12-50-A1]NLR16432.1 hypothetical protein [Pseudoalteromonas peptidolytica]NUZ12594.1 hypothetical protein [Pseudoalteromonas sp. McH1-7]RXE95689.1 hypothetical protein D9603_19925 [Pseudoalteromonas sp. PS5]USD30282.1 hypothetical protein J8Z24_19300 [Pseudoalteromonas sp. SCSIO 43201]